MNYSQFRESISELELYNLISIYSFKNLKENTLIVRLNSPLPIKELIYQPNLTKNIPEDKLTELKYGLEKYEEVSEISFSKNNEEIEVESNTLSPEDNKLYWSFYDQLYKNIGKEFILSHEIIEIIKDSWKNNKIDSAKLIKLSSLSIKLNEKNEYYLSISELDGLIKNELNLMEDDFEVEEYHSFWKNFLNQKDKKELKKQFKKLFSKYTNIIFYLKLTRKKNVPVAMENWIKECVNQKNFNSTMVNGIISFVFTLLKKIPVKYLTTMCENLNNDGIHTTDQLLSHIKEVLKYEKGKKNRLGLTVEGVSR